MKYSLPAAIVICIFAGFAACQAQTEKPVEKKPGTVTTVRTIVGGGCDGCELMYADMPESIDAVDTSAGWFAKKQRLRVTGNVFTPDGKTVATGIIIYYWQTDHTGRYTAAEGQSPKTRRHGQLRGWVKTDAAGNYAIYTSRPAPYPGNTDPAHIHFAIKEPGIGNEYYIDDIVFEDDSLVNAAYRKHRINRGGDGIVSVKKQKGMQAVERNIILGLNVSNYPADKK